MTLKAEELFGIFVEKYDREHLRQREEGSRKKVKLNTRGKEETFCTEQKYLPSSEQMIAPALRTEKEKDGGRERDKALVSGFCRLMLPQMSTYGPLGHMAAIRGYFLLTKHNMEEKELTHLLSSRLSHS